MRRPILLLTCAVGWLLSGTALADFRAEQLAHKRVRDAYGAKRPVVEKAFREQGLPYPPKGIFLRVFKLDRQLELWGQANDGSYKLVRTYPICASSGVPGPKRSEGDAQVPEGFYRIAVFNPASNFHLSLGVDYPNASDRLRGEKGHLGGAIMIHGNCVTIGCVPITDDLIEEVYTAALDARSQGQASIEVHMFPSRLDSAGLDRLTRLAAGKSELLSFWKELSPGYTAFERTHRLPTVTVDKAGHYVVKAR